MFKKTFITLLALFLCTSSAFTKDSKFVKDKTVLDAEAKVEAENRLEAEAEPSKFSIKAYLEESDYMTGDWFGARTYLEDHGVDIQSSYIVNSIVFGQGKGDTKKGKGTYQGLYTLSVELDSEKLGLYKGGKLYAEYMSANRGVSSADYLGTYSFANTYDPTTDMSQLSQFYYEHSFKDDLFNVKIGKQDASLDFQNLDNTGSYFMSASYYFIPNSPIPIYPAPQTGARARLKLNDSWYVQAGIFDGETKVGAGPKTFFNGDLGHVAMAETYYLADIKGYEGKYLAGAWMKTRGRGDGFEVFDCCFDPDNDDGVGPNYKNINYGGYLSFEQKLLHAYDDKSGGLYTFGRFGYAPEDINDVPFYASGGFVWQGIGQKRKEDKIGIAGAWHQFNSPLKELEDRRSEKLVEIFYRFKVTKWFTLQPGFQYIIHPGGNGEGAFALGLRTELIF